MNHLILRPIVKNEEKNIFIKEIQEAFQKSYEKEFGKYEKMVLPIEDIEESFNTKGAEAYIAEVNGNRVGGTVIEVDDELGYNSLHLLYVKSDSQNDGYGGRNGALLKNYIQTQRLGKHIRRIMINGISISM